MEDFKLYELKVLMYEYRVQKLIETGEHPIFLHMYNLVDYLLEDDFEKDVKKDIEITRKFYKQCLNHKKETLTLENKTQLFNNLEDLDKMEDYLKKWFEKNKPKHDLENLENLENIENMI